VTVPVKLTRATNDIHKEHSDTKFCTTAIKYLEEIASVLGPKQVLFISQDDKVSNCPFHHGRPCLLDIIIFILGTCPNWKNGRKQADSTLNAYGLSSEAARP
jgi:hypothetical protein